MLLVPISFVGSLGGDSGAADLVSYEADFDVTYEGAAAAASEVSYAAAQAALRAGPAPVSGATPVRRTEAAPVAASTEGAAAQASAMIESSVPSITTTTTTVVTRVVSETQTATAPAPSSPPVAVELPLDLTPTLETTIRALRSEQGEASWFHAPDGTCAHQTLPFGTLVKVTNLVDGTSTTCEVDDRGPFIDGRVIDLSYDVFQEIAHPGSGVVDVVIEW